MEDIKGHIFCRQMLTTSISRIPTTWTMYGRSLLRRFSYALIRDTRGIPTLSPHSLSERRFPGSSYGNALIFTARCNYDLAWCPLSARNPSPHRTTPQFSHNWCRLLSRLTPEKVDVKQPFAAKVTFLNLIVIRTQHINILRAYYF